MRRIALVLIAAGTLVPAAAAGAADTPSCSTTLGAQALIGPARTDLGVHVETTPGCAPITTIKKLQVKLFAADGTVQDVLNLKDVDPSADVRLVRLDSGQKVGVEALTQDGNSSRTSVTRAAATARLRP